MIFKRTLLIAVATLICTNVSAGSCDHLRGQSGFKKCHLEERRNEAKFKNNSSITLGVGIALSKPLTSIERHFQGKKISRDDALRICNKIGNNNANCHEAKKAAYNKTEFISK